MSLSTAARDAFARLLHDAAGMDFNRANMSILERRLEERIAALGLESWTEYRDRLVIDPAEVDLLVQAVAVNETYFFRHPEQFMVLQRRVLPDRIVEAARAGRMVRIWSAGCSNGCEPYSIAIACAELERTLTSFLWEIFGTDIDIGAVEAARKGVFQRREVSLEMPPEFLDRYFTPAADGRWLLREEVKSRVLFRRQNLTSDLYPADCDVVFCRNVLYYFSPHAGEEVMRRIQDTLNPGGFLFLGQTESTVGWETFFRPADRERRVLQSWTTDRRRGAGRVEAGGGDHRRGERTPMRIDVHSDRRITVSGVVSRPEEIEAFRNGLAIEIGRLGGDVSLDLRDLRWISNGALDVLRRILEAARRRGLLLREILVDRADHREWLSNAGLWNFVSASAAATSATAVERAPETATPLARRKDDRERSPAAPRLSPAPPARPAAAPAPPSAPGFVRFPEAAREDLLDEIRVALGRVLGEVAGGRGDVVLDLSACRLLDEVIARTVVRAARSLVDGQRLVLMGASPAVRRVLGWHLPADPRISWTDAPQASAP